MSRSTIVVALGLGFALLVGAGCKESAHGYCGDPVPGPVGYAQVKPVLDSHCTRCHASALQGLARQSASPGVDYDRYEAASAGSNAARALVRVRAGTMPPGQRIRSGECALLRAWVEAGAPR